MANWLIFRGPDGVNGPASGTWRRRWLRVFALLLGLAAGGASAQTAAGYAEYIVPFDEDVFAFVTQPVSGTTIGANDTTFTLISLTAWTDTVTVYYDHWENGYGYDPSNPDGPGTDEKYVLDAGQTLNFSSAGVPRPRTGADGNTYAGGNCNAQPTPATPLIHNTLDFCYDGRDRVMTIGGATTLTRGGYFNTAGMGKLAAIGEEVYPLAPQLIKYVLPFGESGTLNDFERVTAVVQATEDDTILQIDFNGDGVYDSFNTENGYRTVRVDPVDATTLTLQRGQTYVVDRNSDGVGGTLGQGVVILGSKTLQVEYFYGEAASLYDTRAVSAFPRGFWSRDYYASADGGTVAGSCAGTTCNTNILLYNPNASAITIDWETATGSGSFNIAANTTTFFQAANGGSYVPEGSGVYLHGSGAFWGTSDIDFNDDKWDWGYSLVPTYLLSQEQTVAWAPGNSPPQACNTANARGNGLFLTPVLDNTTVFVDTNNDGTPETGATNASIEVLRGITPLAPTGSGYRVNRLESIYITGSNSGTAAGSPCDLTGARIYATGPFSMSFGENPNRASTAGGLDLGYTVLPSPANWMDLALTVDKSTSPVLVSTAAGVTTVAFTLVVDSHEFNIDSLSVVDTLPPNWTFDSGSAVITLPNLTQISGAGANPSVSLPTLTWGPGLLGSLLPNQRITITFNARTTAAFANGDVTQNNVQAEGTRVVGGVTQTFKATDFAFNTFTDGSLGMTLAKTSSVPEPTPVSPGDTLTYTITPGNPAGTTTTLTGVTVYDPLPPGVSYVPASGSVTCERVRNVRDEFAAAAYNNQGPNNTDNWATSWVETDAYGTFANGAGGAAGAAGGYAAVAGGVLRFTYLLSTVRDNLDTNGSFAGNNGSNAWTTAWTEDNDDGSAAGGDIQIANNRIEFRDTTDGGTVATGEAIRRSATVTGATSVTVQLDWDANNQLDADDDLIVEWSLDGTTWNTLRTLDGGVADGTYTNTIAWTPTDTTFTLRFRAEDAIETNEQARFDDVQVSFNVPANAVGSQVVRTANLAGATAPALTLTTSSAGLAAGDTVLLEAANSPAGPFAVLATSTGNVGAGAFAPAGPYDLTPYASATTAIRLRVTGGYDATAKVLNVDNVDIGYGVASTFASGTPPELVAAASGCRLRPGTSMSVTFQVTVDNPFPAGQDQILNVATVGVAQIPVPLTASARNIVIVPGGLTGTVGDRVWLDGDADGVFDAGETGIAGVEVTLKDQFGTPLQVTTTDSLGRYTFFDVPTGSGYFVEITGGLPAGLIQTTDTVGDAFDVNGVFSGNNGTLNWLTSWTENNDTGSATTGDIQIANNRLEFRDTTDGGTVATGESIQRSASVAGATSLELQYSWDPVALEADGSDNIIVEYSTNGTTWVTARTLNGNAAGTYVDTIPWTPTNGTAFVRFRAEDAIEAGEQARLDNVQLRFPQSLRTASFNLAPGQDYVQADLGFRAAPNTAAIGDLVWVDANSDQVRNPGEPGLAGITVDLYEDTDGDGLPNGSPVATTVTGPGGAYLFTGVPADGVRDWVVTMNTGQGPLAGYTATTNTLFSYANLPSGAVRVDADFGFNNPTATFTITDGVWLDNGLPTGTANNGVKDGTEAGIAGVTVDLLDSAGNTIATALTGSDGRFQFTGVPAGQNYRWRVTDTAGVLADYYGTTPSALSSTFQMVGNLTGNLDYTAPSDVRHFGYNQTRSVGDTVWNDLDGDGTLDVGEPGLGGVTLLLYRDDGDGIFEPGAGDGNPIATQVTDTNGQYLFAGLAAGTYWVSVDSTQSALSGYTLTTPDNSGVAGHQRLSLPLSGPANWLDGDFGYQATTPFAISGRFFSDLNRSGSDAGEPGFAGVTVELRNTSGVVVGTATTDVTGAYGFPGLPAGTYTVRVTDATGVLTGYETTFERTEGGLAALYNGQETVTLGPNVADVNFGFYRGNNQPTRALLSSFVAREVAGAVALEWVTASEVGTVGFYVRRWDEQGKRYLDLNDKLLPALVGAPQGGVYRWLDPQAEPGRPYRYALTEVEASGEWRGYGPFDVDTRLTLDDAGAEAALDDQALREQGYSRAPHREDPAARQARASEAAADQARADRSRSASAAKIGVPGPGLYYVDLPALRARGVKTGSLVAASLTNRGEAVAYAPSNDQTGIFFYARGPQSELEKDDVYRLSADPGGLQMQTRPNPPVPPPSGAESYARTLHVEEDAIAVPSVFHDPDGDFWIWDFVYAGYGAKTFTFRTDGATRAGQATLTIRLKGGTDTQADPDHHATFSLNGTSLGDASWDGLQAHEASLAIDASLLVDGENTLTVDGLADTGAPYSLFYVDSFDLQYTTTYRAHGNQLEFPAAGNAAVLVSGFTQPDVAVFDITDPLRPEIVQAPVTPPLPDGTYGVVVASSNPQAVYYALAPDAVRSPGRILADTPSALRQPDNQARYLVISTDALRPAAQALADHRADLSSQVVDVEDVYDEFNHGVASPYALRAFLAYARSHWQTPPLYVVLAGDGSHDYRDRLGYGDNLIPPMMADTPFGLYPSDAWFAAAKAGDFVSVGRLPVATGAELAQVTAKIQAREAGLAEGWAWSTLLVADDPDAAGNFTASSEGVAGRVPEEVPLQRAYVASVGAAQARSALLAALNAGTGLVSYFGHAGYGQLADESLLTNADVPTLANADRPTVLTAMTCLAGDSNLPGFPGLGERLLRHPGGGAAAVWAPSGMSENELAEPLGEALYAALYTGRKVERLGDAVALARRVYRDRDLPGYMLSIYNLLGDPAMRLR